MLVCSSNDARGENISLERISHRRVYVYWYSVLRTEIDFLQKPTANMQVAYRLDSSPGMMKSPLPPGAHPMIIASGMICVPSTRRTRRDTCASRIPPRCERNPYIAAATEYSPSVHTVVSYPRVENGSIVETLSGNDVKPYQKMFNVRRATP